MPGLENHPFHKKGRQQGAKNRSGRGNQVLSAWSHSNDQCTLSKNYNTRQYFNLCWWRFRSTWLHSPLSWFWFRRTSFKPRLVNLLVRNPRIIAYSSTFCALNGTYKMLRRVCLMLYTAYSMDYEHWILIVTILVNITWEPKKDGPIPHIVLYCKTFGILRPWLQGPRFVVVEFLCYVCIARQWITLKCT